MDAPIEQPPQEEGVDFSRYQSPALRTVKPHLPPQGPTIRRIWILIAIFSVLLLTQMILWLLNRPPKAEIPAGYQLIQSGNGPPRMEKKP